MIELSNVPALDEINADYTEELNMLLEEGREDLVADLSDRYLREIAHLLQAG